MYICILTSAQYFHYVPGSLATAGDSFSHIFRSLPHVILQVAIFFNCYTHVTTIYLSRFFLKYGISDFPYHKPNLITHNILRFPRKLRFYGIHNNNIPILLFVLLDFCWVLTLLIYYFCTKSIHLNLSYLKLVWLGPYFHYFSGPLKVASPKFPARSLTFFDLNFCEFMANEWYGTNFH